MLMYINNLDMKNNKDTDEYIIETETDCKVYKFSRTLTSTGFIISILILLLIIFLIYWFMCK